MKKAIRLLLCGCFAIFVIGLGIFILQGCFHNEGNEFIVGLMGYLGILYFITKTSYFQNHVLTNLRGGRLSFKTKNFPRHLSVGKNVKVFHPDRILFGDNCNISEGVVFAPLCERDGNKYPSEIVVGNNVHFGTQDRIASMNSVIIEDDVLFAAFVHITDHSHEYRKVGLPIRKQSVFSKGPVVIKRGVWLAFGCHILSGVTVGECSVVAANSVVTKDVPPYSVVAGNPARIINQYDFETHTWKKVR